MTNRESAAYTRAIKALGQNFCTDPRLPLEMVNRLAPTEGDVVWEIGPGTGALTEKLLATKAKIVAFEIDERMRNELLRFGSALSVVWGDFLKLELEPFIPSCKRLLVTGNLPYCCGTAIMRRVLSIRNPVAPHKLVFLLQDEVARKAAAPPGSDSYGFLSAQVQLFAEAHLGGRFSPASFKPAPKVYSTILELHPLEMDEKERLLRLDALELLSAMLAQRRKMALPILRRKFPSAVPSWEDRFIALGIDFKARGETLPLETVLELAAHSFK